MKVELIDYTGIGRVWYAARLLVATKHARLKSADELIDTELSTEDILKELEAMASTIPSSWEFVSVTFIIRGITRATAQQMTRTRTGSYAMQSLRVVNAEEVEINNPIPTGTLGHDVFDAGVTYARSVYGTLLAANYAKEDARGILPMNTSTTLMARYNLRAFVQLVRSRSSLRTQGEYAEVIREMKRLVTEAWPWSEVFFIPKEQLAIKLLEEAAREVGLTTGGGVGWKIAKAADLLRGSE